jgi:hypothetical protein
MPHYGFEVLTWIGWNVAINQISWPAILFACISTAAMFGKAKEKKAVYLKKFDGQNGQPKYPESAKLLFPFLL